MEGISLLNEPGYWRVNGEADLPAQENCGYPYSDVDMEPPYLGTRLEPQPEKTTKGFLLLKQSIESVLQLNSAIFPHGKVHPDTI